MFAGGGVRFQGNDGQPDIHTQKEHTHARQRRHNTTAGPRLRRGAGRCCCRAAATAAAAAAAAAAAVLLLCCCCAAAASRPALHRGAQSVSTDVSRYVFFGTHAGASNGTAAAAAAVAAAAAAQQQVQQQGRPKHMYEYTPRHQAVSELVTSGEKGMLYY